MIALSALQIVALVARDQIWVAARHFALILSLERGKKLELFKKLLLYMQLLIIRLIRFEAVVFYTV